MSDNQFAIGLTGEASVVVSYEVTAKHMGSGAVAVFATPEMVRLMERAAVNGLASYLAPGQRPRGGRPMRITLVFPRTPLVLLLAALLCALAVNPAAGKTDTPQNCTAHQSNYFDIYPSPAYAADQTLFAGVIAADGSGHQLLKSTDRGLSWRPVYGLAGDVVITDLAFSPGYEHDHQILLATWGQILLSSDAGETWSPVKTLEPGVSPLVAIAADGALFLALGTPVPYFPLERQGVFRSTDGGATWTQLYQDRVDQLAVSPDYVQDQLVLIGVAGYHSGTIFRSTDGGLTWHESNAGLYPATVPGVSDIRFSPDYLRDQTVFCLNYGELYKSTDSGLHWTDQTAQSDPDGGILWSYFLASPRYGADQTLWVDGTDYGDQVVWTSTDGGANWRPLAPAPRPLAAAAYCLADGRCGVELFGKTYDLTTDLVYLYRSFTGGQTWQCLEDPALPPPPRAWLPWIQTGP